MDRRPVVLDPRGAGRYAGGWALVPVIWLGLIFAVVLVLVTLGALGAFSLVKAARGDLLPRPYGTAKSSETQL